MRRDDFKLPPDVQRLLDEEREFPPVPKDVASRLEMRIARRLNVPFEAERIPWRTRLRSLLGVLPGWAFPMVAFGLGATAGVGVGSGWVSREHRQANAGLHPAPEIRSPLVPAPDVSPPPPTPEPPAVQEAPARTEEPAHAPVPSAPSAAVPPKTAGPDSLDQERALIERARTALYRGSDETAIHLLDQCARAFPNGQLAEEREALWIQSAVGAAKYKAARERGRAFVQKYPHSFLLPSVEEALRSISE